MFLAGVIPYFHTRILGKLTASAHISKTSQLRNLRSESTVPFCSFALLVLHPTQISNSFTLVETENLYHELELS